MRSIFFYISILFSILSFSQKKIERTITVDKNTSSIAFDLNDVFTISLSTAKTDVITIKAISEGEYANHFVITERVQQNTITIASIIAFTFPNNGDKLSTHKIHAIAMEIVVPENLEIFIKSDIGNLNAFGNYQELKGNFISGDCSLNNTTGDINIQTISGDINLLAKNGYIKTTSKTGSITTEKIPLGKSIFALKTVKGNINIRHTK